MLHYIPGQRKYETQPAYDLKLIEFTLKLVDWICFSFRQQRSFNYDKATAFRLSFIVYRLYDVTLSISRLIFSPGRLQKSIFNQVTSCIRMIYLFTISRFM